MKKTLAFALLFVLGVGSVLIAGEQATIRDITVDRLLDGVRVTIACDRPPNVSSFVSAQPAAIVIDLMDAVNGTGRERFESAHYPVTAVTMQASEATTGYRVAVRLRDMVKSRVTQEGNLVVIELGIVPLPPPAAPPPADPFAGKILTLLVKDAQVSDVLRMVASQFDLNILMTQDVKQQVTVRVNEVPLRDGIDALLKAALCNMVEQDNGIYVVKPVRQEIYGELHTRLYTLDYVEADDAAKAVKEALSPEGKAEVSYRRVDDGSGSDRSGLLIVTDIPEAHRRVAEFLAVLDRPVPQVAIEAKFIETTRSSEDRYGIDWQIRASASTGGWDASRDFGIPIVFDQMVLGKISLDQMNASLDLLATRGNSRVLANPRTMTLSNQKATVSMGVNVPLREINKDGNTGEITYTWRTRSIPIQLEVTPYVTSDGKVTMHVKPSVEAITGWVGSADDQQPIVAKREAETQVTVSDGEVVVIGGLVKEEETRTIGKIPLLGDIPVLGHLFKKTSVRREQNDLMIFIIPHVLPMES
ncbi:MAG TPA: type IV pilus secretin family protein [candidate division WOR-3 bacterium]|uniref:Type IV pilus secretin family protein n=1 Tax=candidate division WOR-3 bacterium TaxID=2052148 RepID=A0A7V0T5U6_UNCW3|nr:type IV pilus secretin family protein [candidate division WOR-3 bacterium]